MKTFTLFCILSSVFLSAVSAKPQKHAVLVAASKSWLYYRHQATVLHAYQTLLANGFNKDNIIVMQYDDLANNPKNPEKGVVRNHPFGENLYPNSKKCYTGDKINAETFLAVLAGDEAKAKGPVLKSGPKDTVFIYFVGLGGTQYLTFPSGPGLPAQKYVAALKKLRSDKKAKKVLVFHETSFAASHFAGLIPRKHNIFVFTATHYNELPGAVYCNSQLRLCYGSLFGCGWTQRSDRLRQMKFGAKNSIWDFFNYVRTVTTYTHANMFGHLEIGRSKISDFLDYKLVPRKQSAARSGILENLALAAINDANDKFELEEDNDEIGENAENAENAMELDALYNYLKVEDDMRFDSTDLLLNSVSNLDAVLMSAAPAEDKEARSIIIENRDMVSNTMKDIFTQIRVKDAGLKKIIEQSMDNYYEIPPLSEEQSEVYDSAIKAFNSLCFDIIENTYAQIEMGRLAVLASLNVGLDEQVRAMESVCTTHHRMARSIH